MTNAMSKSYFTHVAYRENRSIVHDISHIAVDDYLDEVDIYCAIIDEDDCELDNEGSDVGEINFFFDNENISARNLSNLYATLAAEV